MCRLACLCLCMRARVGCMPTQGSAFSHRLLIASNPAVGLVPGNEGVVVVEATGKELLHTLEEGVSHYPRLSARFPQVSGIHFAFAPGHVAGSRLVASSVTVGGEPLHMDACVVARGGKEARLPAPALTLNRRPSRPHACVHALTARIALQRRCRRYGATRRLKH